MKFKIPWEVVQKKGREIFGRYKYVLLMVLVGAVFLLWPTAEETKKESGGESTGAEESEFSLRETEERLSRTLSRVQGAGDVTVMLTVRGGVRRVLAEDEASQLDEDGSSKVERSVVTLSGGSGAGEKTVVLQTLEPEFQGAVVVCEGGDNARVKLKLMEAVAALTGLGTDKITICKGKG